jgi:hypothetical protein
MSIVCLSSDHRDRRIPPSPKAREHFIRRSSPLPVSDKWQGRNLEGVEV